MSTRGGGTDGGPGQGVPAMPGIGLADGGDGALSRERLAACRLHADLMAPQEAATDIEALPDLLKATLDASERLHARFRAQHPEATRAAMAPSPVRRPSHGYALEEEGDPGLRLDRTF